MHVSDIPLVSHRLESIQKKIHEKGHQFLMSLLEHVHTSHDNTDPTSELEVIYNDIHDLHHELQTMRMQFEVNVQEEGRGQVDIDMARVDADRNALLSQAHDVETYGEKVALLKGLHDPETLPDESYRSIYSFPTVISKLSNNDKKL